MPLTMRQWMTGPVVGRAALVFGIGVLLGFAGPFGANPPLSAPVRYGFWIAMAFAGYAAALAAERVVPHGIVSHPVLRPAAVAIASAAPMTFVAAWAVSLVRPGHLYPPLQLPALFGAVAVVQLLLVLALPRRASGPVQRTGEGGAEASGPSSSTLLSRLPKRLGEEIIALEAEDHYVRVHTMLGSDLVLMRLSDAIAALEPGSGLQAHRSWWVALDAIGEMSRSGQRSELRLRNGMLVPVGRTYAGAVRAWAERRRPGA